MTTGQLVFYGGWALLGLTVIAAIVFLVKKPVYRPDSPIYEEAGRARPLRSGYLTEGEAIGRSSPKQMEPVETEAFYGETGTTEVLGAETEVLSQELELRDGRTSAPPDGSNL